MARAMGKGHHALAGLLLAAAALLRMFPILFVGYLVIRRRRRELLYTVSMLAAGGLITLMLVGVHTSLDFVRAVDYVTHPRWLIQKENIALAAVIFRLFRAFGDTPTPSMEIARQAVTSAARLAILGLTIQATVKSRPDQVHDDSAALSVWFPAMILLSPTAWVHYLVILLFPYAAMLKSASRGLAPIRASAMMILSYVLINSRFLFVIITQLHVGALAPFRPYTSFLLLDVSGACAFLSLLSAWLACYWWAIDKERPTAELQEPPEAALVGGAARI
jgi:hypothetical protein